MKKTKAETAIEMAKKMYEELKVKFDAEIDRVPNAWDNVIQTEQNNVKEFINQLKDAKNISQLKKKKLAAEALQHYQDVVIEVNKQRVLFFKRMWRMSTNALDLIYRWRFSMSILWSCN